MLSDAQREVAIHLLANAIRQAYLREGTRMPPEFGSRSIAGASVPSRRNSSEAYLRGMFDLLRGLYGATSAEELYRAAQTLERSPKGH